MAEGSEEARLRRWSQTVANACLVGALALPTLVLVGYFLSENDWPVWANVLGLVPVALLSTSMFSMHRCFTAFAQGNWFSEHPAHHLRLSGIWLAGAGLAGILVPNLVGALLADNSITLSLNSSQILGLLFGIIIWNLGAIWQKAHLLAKENAEFV